MWPPTTNVVSSSRWSDLAEKKLFPFVYELHILRCVLFKYIPQNIKTGIEWLIWLFGVHFRFQLLEISGATFGDLTSFLVMRQKQQLMLTFCHLVLGRFAKHQSDEVYCDGPPEPLLEEPERQRATDPSLWQLVARLFGSFWVSPQLWRINISHTFRIKLASFGVSRYQQVSDTPIWQLWPYRIYIYAYTYSLCRKETAWSWYSYSFATNVCTNSQTAHLVNPAKGVAALHFALNGAWYIHIYIIWLQISYRKC